MDGEITLDNIEKFTIPLQQHGTKWFFESEDATLPSPEHMDQIYPLNNDASIYLWDLQSRVRINSFYPANIGKYFKDVEKFNVGKNTDSEVRKWLYRRGVPFSNKVFLAMQPSQGLVMTWKMVIKYSDRIFVGSDLTIWDKTVNWALYFSHDDVFHFARNRIYDGVDDTLKLEEMKREINKNRVSK